MSVDSGSVDRASSTCSTGSTVISSSPVCQWLVRCNRRLVAMDVKRSFVSVNAAPCAPTASPD